MRTPLPALALALLSVVALSLRHEGRVRAQASDEVTLPGSYLTVLPSAGVVPSGLAPSQTDPDETAQSGAADAPREPGPDPDLSPGDVPRANALLDDTSAAAPPDVTIAAPPPVPSPSFAGMGSTVNPVTIRPPDPTIAAGPVHLMETVNITARVFDKTGAELRTFSLSSLLGVPAGWREADPRVIYDAQSGRFFLTYFAFIDNATGNDFATLYAAVSTTSNPLDNWHVYRHQFVNTLPDYPAIAASTDKVTVSWNSFDIDDTPGGYLGAQTVVMQKSQMLTGGAASSLMTSASPDFFTIRPAQMLTPNATQYMASVDFGLSTRAHLWQVTGTPAQNNVSITRVAQPAIAGLASPPDAEAMGSTALIATNDNRVLDAVWRDGRLWFGATSACVFATEPTVERACLGLIEINTATNSTAQDILFGAPGAYAYYPSVMTDGIGNLVVVFSASSGASFINALVAGRLITEPPNTMSGARTLKAGEVAYNPPPSPREPPYRWGDYMGASVDPTDASRIWTVGQYAKNDGLVLWGTWIGAVRYDADNDGRGDAVDNCPQATNADQTNTDNAPIATPGVAAIDVTIANGDFAGDACDPDDDNDGLLDTVEVAAQPCASTPLALNSLRLDSDGDLVADRAECFLGTNAASAASVPLAVPPGDSDGDGLPSTLETTLGSSPSLVDSDSDGITDGVEVRGYNSLPNAANTDGDSCPDGTEIASVDGSTTVDSLDLVIVARQFFASNTPNLDVNKSGVVDSIDLAIVALRFNSLPC